MLWWLRVAAPRWRRTDLRYVQGAVHEGETCFISYSPVHVLPAPFQCVTDLTDSTVCVRLLRCQVLKDGMLENLTPQLFLDVNKPKYDGTVNLDK